MDNQLRPGVPKVNKFIKPAIALLLIAVFFIGLIFFWVKQEQKSVYIIPGVPYFSIWNHRGEAAAFNEETAAAVFSVLNYWSPGIAKPAETENFFEVSIKASKSVDLVNVEEYVDQIAKDQYTVKPVVLKNNEIKEYINAEVKTPLFAFLPISDEQPAELSFNSLIVIIGIDEVEEKIIAHDFWLGNNREIRFEELDKLWEKKSSEKRNKYFIIQPRNLKKFLAGISLRKMEPYPARTALMAKNEAMIKNCILGIKFQTEQNYDLAGSLFSKVENEPGFQDDFIPVLKVQVLARLASIKLLEGDLTGALKYAEKAVEMNHDINKPLANGWPGYEYNNRSDEINRGKSSDPDRVIGNIYKAMGEKDKAIAAYKRALEINPGIQAVVTALNELEK